MLIAAVWWCAAIVGPNGHRIFFLPAVAATLDGAVYALTSIARSKGAPSWTPDRAYLPELWRWYRQRSRGA
jgi:hypothetical protein